MSVGFDDRKWWRQPLPIPGPTFSELYIGTYDAGGVHRPNTVALICLRGKFTVTDPGQVENLLLDVSFRGGLVVYLNGKEVLRRFMPEGQSGFEALGEDYPAECFEISEKAPEKSPDFAEKMKKRLRSVNSALPKNLLVKGTNVLGIEVHRTALVPNKPRWNNCGVEKIELVAEGAGIEPNISRPKGKIQVWNANLLEEVTDVDYGDPHDAVVPVEIVGTRGGYFSGQVVVSSDREIRGLSASVTELVAEAGSGKLSREHLSIYYPALSEKSLYVNPRYPFSSGHKGLQVGIGEMLVADACLSNPPESVPVRVKKRIASGYPYIWGAVQPIWLVVEVPKEVNSGIYSGVIKIKAEGMNEVSVPVRVKVCEWQLPPRKEFGTFIDLIQSPDHLARHYKVMLWSEKHWQLIERTFSLMSMAGNKTVYVPAIIPTHFGNTETMIRWVKGKDGTFTYDFSVMERYLDTAMRYFGKPRVVCVYVWDVYLGGEVHRMTGGMGPHAQKYREDMVGVSVVEPGSGRIETMEIPAYGEKGELYWIPFGKALIEFMEKKGLRDVLMIGMASDIRPTKAQVEFWQKVLPGVPWVAQGHDRADQIHGVPVGYSASVFGCYFALADPEIKRLYGWQRPNVTTLFPRRVGEWLVCSHLFYKLTPEWNLAGFQNGVGRIAADFFPKPTYPEKARWGNASLQSNWLAAGPDGAIPTAGYLLFVEGVQECEARIFIEKALCDTSLRAKLGDSLVRRCQQLLDERTRYAMWCFDISFYNYNDAGAMFGKAMPVGWFAGSGWQERNEKLFSMAEEVSRCIKR
jgi:hypothetical protein